MSDAGPFARCPFSDEGLSHNDVACHEMIPTISLMHRMDEEEAYLVIR